MSIPQKESSSPFGAQRRGDHLTSKVALIGPVMWRPPKRRKGRSLNLMVAVAPTPGVPLVPYVHRRMTFPSASPASDTPYFSLFLDRIRETHPDFPLDPVIFQSILLCLVAGGPPPPEPLVGQSSSSRGCKNLILRTNPEDIGLVLNLATLVSSI